jgi:GLPGLI family protein
MKKLILLFLLFPLLNMAQNLKVTYAETGNIDAQLKNEKDPEVRKMVAAQLAKPIIFTLYLQTKQSAYIKKEAITTGTDAEKKQINIGSSNKGLVKNYNEKKYYDACDIFGKQFLVTDVLHDIKWTITKETKKIGEYTCTKATATNNNENITAWYTTKIAVSNGPRFYGGLPGLIIELADAKKYYSATKVENNTPAIKIETPTVGKKITQAEYNKEIEDFMQGLKNGNGKITIGG